MQSQEEFVRQSWLDDLEELESDTDEHNQVCTIERLKYEPGTKNASTRLARLALEGSTVCQTSYSLLPMLPLTLTLDLLSQLGMDALPPGAREDSFNTPTSREVPGPHSVTVLCSPIMLMVALALYVPVLWTGISK